MKYPNVSPDNVSRDLIENFGGYNHNLRIGDNEFYDMENMTSSYAPVLSTRGRRGEADSNFIPPSNEPIVGVLYRSALFCATCVTANSIRYLKLYKDGTLMRSFPTSYPAAKLRNLILQGAYLISFPDGVYVNIESYNSQSDEYTDRGNIDATVTTVAATLKPCLYDGSIVDIEYCGSDPPAVPSDGYCWLDTSTEPAVLKRYDAKESVWIPVMFQYIRITSENDDISSMFREGDGVKISGTQTDLDGVSIIRKIPTNDNNRSLVFSGQFENAGSIQVFEPIDVQKKKKSTSVRVYCDSTVVQNSFQGRYFIIGDKKVKCTGNLDAAPYEYWVDRNLNLYPTMEEMRTIDRKQSGQAIERDGLSVKSPSHGSAFDTAAANERVFVRVGKNGEIYEYFRESSYPTPAIGGILIKLCAVSESRIYNNPSYVIPADSVLYPVEQGDSLGLFETTLTFNDDVEITGKFCIDPKYSKNGTNITFSRKMPIMDFVIESRNRLWGCRYGANNDGKIVNEIYCSKQGDKGFTNWQCYEGISTDSYAASCGTDGEWTGAINYNGNPLFFKENYIHLVQGNYPPYTITDIPARGVKRGCAASLAILNETLIYYSTHGVCAYNGSLPTDISSAFGGEIYSQAFACAYNGKYYVSLQPSVGRRVLMVYDAKRQIWHKEDGSGIDYGFVSMSDNIYYINTTRKIKALFGNTEDPLTWYVETGLLGLGMIDRKYIERINIRLSLAEGTVMRVLIDCDSAGTWTQLCEKTGTGLRPFTLPIKPRRCDHFRLRIEGTGDAKIFSISKTIEQGSDLPQW